MSDVNQRLQASLAETTKAHQAERLKRDNLHKQVGPVIVDIGAICNRLLCLCLCAVIDASWAFGWAC